MSDRSKHIQRVLASPQQTADVVGGGQLVILYNTERCNIENWADTQAERRKYCWFVMCASTSEYYLLRFCAVQFQVIILSPGLNVRQFAFTSGWVGRWYDYVSVVSKLCTG